MVRPYKSYEDICKRKCIFITPLKNLSEVAEWCKNWLMYDDYMRRPYVPVVEIAGHDRLIFTLENYDNEYDVQSFRSISFRFLKDLHKILDDGLNFYVVFAEDGKSWRLEFDYKRFYEIEET